MLNLTCEAEVRHLIVRPEDQGDAIIPAADIKLMLIELPIADLSPLCQNLERLYDGDEPALGEINPLVVRHKVENVTAKIAAVRIKGCDIKTGAKITLLPGKVASVELVLQVSHAARFILELLGMYRLQVAASITERQLDLVNNG